MGSGSSSGTDGERKRLLVLGAGPAQLGLHRAARERGLFVIACDRDPTAVGFEYADRRAVVSVEDEAAIVQLARAEQVDGIIAPGIDWPVAIAARIAAHAGLPHPIAPETAALTVLKHRQRKRLDEEGVPQPRWEVATAAGDGLPLPAVVKPVDRQGQKGLTVVSDATELAEAIAAAVEASRNGLALVEELVPGPEITVNAFSVGGVFHPLTVTDRLTGTGPAFGVALAHAWPSAHAVEEAVGAARLAADALGVTDGPTYTQIVLGPDGPRVMELAARLGGGHDAELCRVALGIDLNGLALAAALGEPVELPEPDAGSEAPSSASSSRPRASSRTWTGSRRRSPSTASSTRASTARRAGSSAPSAGATTAPATSSPAATAATTRSPAPTGPPS